MSSRHPDVPFSPSRRASRSGKPRTNCGHPTSNIKFRGVRLPFVTPRGSPGVLHDKVLFSISNNEHAMIEVLTTPAPARACVRGPPPPQMSSLKTLDQLSSSHPGSTRPAVVKHKASKHRRQSSLGTTPTQGAGVRGHRNTSKCQTNGPSKVPEA